MNRCAIVWFRRDLRLADNPALTAALERGFDTIVPVFIHAPDELEPWATGGAQRVWLHFSLTTLDAALRDLESRLIIRRGPALEALQALIGETDATAVYWNRLYDPQEIVRDKRIKSTLKAGNIQAESFNAGLLHEPWQIATDQGKPYKVFTPYWRKARQLPVSAPLAAPMQLPSIKASLNSLTASELQLLPRIRWDQGIRAAWTPGEQGAHERLASFADHVLGNYSESREQPDTKGTSYLSPHLHFGEVGPRQIIHRVDEWRYDNNSEICHQQANRFLSEIGWREFAHHVLYYFPGTPEQSLDPRFKAFPWKKPSTGNALRRWQQGQTGIPMVDAGMRELWATGYMHNRLRMTVASFLTKNLRLPWQLGERWFWDTLVDADLANNTLGWQWAAGCGADAAPFFRIFNPTRQGERFDPKGDYVRHWVPELAGLPARHIHRPWDASASDLQAAGITLGKTYPQPLIDLKISRREALEAFEKIKN